MSFFAVAAYFIRHGAACAGALGILLVAVGDHLWPPVFWFGYGLLGWSVLLFALAGGGRNS